MNESARLRALRSLEILDTSAEPLFDRIARLASSLCGTPIALVSLVDADRQWFKANVGLEGVAETPRAVAFCDSTIRGEQAFVVEDAQADLRFAENPLVTGAPHIRFYAGVPIRMPNGAAIGTVCVIDRKARCLSDGQRGHLEELAALAQEALVSRRSLIDARRRADQNLLRHFIETAPVALFQTDRSGNIVFANGHWVRLFGVPAEQALGSAWHAACAASTGNDLRLAWERAVAERLAFRAEAQVVREDGVVDVLVSAVPMGPHGTSDGYVGIALDIKVRKLVERKLADSTEMLRRAEQIAHVGGWIADLAERTLRWTPGMNAIHGVPAEFVPAFNEHRRFFDEASNAQIDRAAAAAVTEGRGWDLRLPMRRPDGSEVWIRSVGYPEVEDGRVRRLVGMLQDITQSHQRELKLAATNELLSAVVDNLPCGLSAFDGSLRILMDNAEFRRLLDLPPSLFADGPGDFQRIIRFNADRGEYGPDADAAFASIVARARETVPHAFQRTRPDGTVLDIRGAPLPHGGFVTTYVDVTAASRMQEALRRSEERQKRALDASQVVLWDYDAAADVLYLSERWSELMGGARVPTEASMAALIARIPEEERGAVRAAWLAALKGSASEFTSEHRVMAAHGAEVWFMVLGQVVERDASGRAVRVTGTNTDITRRKRMEHELQEAKAAAEGSNRAKSDFIATVSHEMRTPLHGVLTLIRLIRSGSDREGVAKYARLAESSAESLLNLINDLLDESKLEAGQLSVASAEFDHGAMLDEIEAVYRERASEKRLEFALLRGPGVSRNVRLDGFRLRQILQNLLSNAMKFTPSGSVRLEVSSESHGVLTYEVKDTGIGMSEAARGRLFERFQQAEASTAGKFGGTGLGLAISRQLARLMGGDIEVTSHEGGGSAFLVRVPFEACETQSAQPAPASAVIPRTATPRKGTVLVVDDHEMNRFVAGELLARLGVSKIETAADGETAVELALAERPGLVLMDCQMPGMNGYQAATRLRESGFRGAIVAFTAGESEAEAARCAAAGMDATLGKPVDIDRLRSTLDRWLLPEPAPAPVEFDRAQFDNRFSFSPDVGEKALAMFLEAGASDIQLLLQHAQRGDRDSIRMISHKLAGSSATLAAEQLRRLCADLESCTADTCLAELRRGSAEVLDAFGRFERIARNILPG